MSMEHNIPSGSMIRNPVLWWITVKMTMQAGWSFTVSYKSRLTAVSLRYQRVVNGMWVIISICVPPFTIGIFILGHGFACRIMCRILWNRISLPFIVWNFGIRMELCCRHWKTGKEKYSHGRMKYRKALYPIHFLWTRCRVRWNWTSAFVRTGMRMEICYR